MFSSVDTFSSVDMYSSVDILSSENMFRKPVVQKTLSSEDMTISPDEIR